MSATLHTSAPERTDVRDVLTCAAAGGIAGLVVGGLGGRLAMFVLRLTSSDVLHGMLTDDEFRIGSFTLGTIFLLGFCGAAGVMAGALYGALRPYLALPPVATASVLGATAGGSLLIHPGGLDFTYLDPLWLAVAMFVAIPAAGAAAIVVLAERWLAAGWWGRDRARTALTLVPVLGAVPLAPLAVPVALVAVAGVAGARRGWHQVSAVRAAVALVLVAACVAGAVALVHDVEAIL